MVSKVTTEKKIISTAKEKFFANGFQKTTVDELASELKISKKTIYKYFSSKEEIAGAVMVEMRNYISSKVTEIVSSKATSVDKLYKFTQVLSELSVSVNNRWLDDMRIYLPEIWKQVDEFRAKVLYTNFKRIFEQGKREGLVNDNDNEIMLQILVASIQKIISPDFILNNNYSLKSALDELISVLMNGMLTSKGNKQLTKVKRN